MSSSNGGPSGASTVNYQSLTADPVTGTPDATFAKALASTSGSAAASSAVSLTTRIRQSMAQAAPRNPFVNPPWIAEAAWIASTAYTNAGQIVQNGGNRYVLQTTGTSAASGGPSGTGAALITDGTCKWYYDGPARSASAFPAAPVVSIAAPTGLTKYVSYSTAGAFFFTSGNPTVQSGGYRFPSINITPTAGNAYSTYDSQGGILSFKSDAPKICIQGTNAYYNNSALVIEVDGQFISPGCLVPAATTNPGGYVIDWSGARKMRRYRVWLAPNFSFTGVYVDTASVVVAENNPNRFRIVVNGDSLTQGANGVPFLGRSWVDNFAYQVGCDDYYFCAAGATGFLNNNSGNKTTFIQRLPDVIGFAPEVHIVAGNYNDISYSSDQRRSAVAAYISQFRSQSSAWLFMFGPTSGSLGASGAKTAEQDIQAAVLAANDAKTVFFPVSTDTIPWIDGTGNVGAPSGSGNADAYIQAGGAPHYVQAGVEYVAQRYASAWVNFWNGK